MQRSSGRLCPQPRRGAEHRGRTHESTRRGARPPQVSLDDHGVAPPLDTAQGWLTGTAPALEDRVVVYQFWTFGCVNCQRTLPYLRAIYDRYRPDGLEIVGIHYPEFGYEREPAAIAEAARKHGVNWPVLLDNDGSNWINFDNRFWPRSYVLDREGHIRFDHIGEGAYLETENAVRELLGVEPDAPRAVFPTDS